MTRLGATLGAGGDCEFLVWAPAQERVAVLLGDRRVVMDRGERGYHRAAVEGVREGDRYWLEIAGSVRRPDPASRWQPEGVHGPSAVVGAPAPRRSRFENPPIGEHIFYEAHVGTFTPEGTFEAMIPRLDDLKALGVTALELMPIGEFPGGRNWGYDGVALFAAQSAYGGPAGLRRLVDACHERGLAVILDVVYNHLGPEGNYLSDFGPYFTEKYRTPWGKALNFDGPESDEVRRFFVENALYWTVEMGIDGLRLDAVHAILDHSANPFVEEIAVKVHAGAGADGRRALVIAESADNDPRIVRDRDRGGWGLDGTWNDDYHHAVRAALTGEREGYYCAFGGASLVAKALRDRFVYTGEWSSHYRRRHGRRADDVPFDRMVVFAQNHDQVGNRMMGDRLGASAGLSAQRVAAGVVMLSPFTPLVFMGEEYADPAPFMYFVSHTDAALVEAVRRGRREEFAAFAWEGEAPDPQAEATFERSKLDWALRARGEHAGMLAYYRRLIELRRSLRASGALTEAMGAEAREEDGVVTAWFPGMVWAANLGSAGAAVMLEAPGCERALSSEEERWGGGGTASAERIGSRAEVRLAAREFVVYVER